MESCRQGHRATMNSLGMATQGLANYLKKSFSEPIRVVISHDSRHHSREFAVQTAEILSANGTIRAHIKPTESGRDGSLTQAIMETASGNNWKLHELHTEEGRLDEYFRLITRPDTENAAK